MVDNQKCTFAVQGERLSKWEDKVLAHQGCQLYLACQLIFKAIRIVSQLVNVLGACEETQTETNLG